MSKATNEVIPGPGSTPNDILQEKLIHTKVFDLPKQEKKLVITTVGIVALGEVIAESYLRSR